MELLNSALNILIEGLLFIFLIYGGLTALVLFFSSSSASAAPVDIQPLLESPAPAVAEETTADAVGSLQAELERTRATFAVTQETLREAQQELAQYRTNLAASAPQKNSQQEPVVLENPWEEETTAVHQQSAIAAEPSLPEIARDELKIWIRKGSKVVKEATIPIEVPAGIQRLRFRKTAVIRLSDLLQIAVVA